MVGYDTMIEKLRPLGKIFIGVAYEKQYCKDLPVEKHDQKLDIIITEMCVDVEVDCSKKWIKKNRSLPFPFPPSPSHQRVLVSPVLACSELGLSN